MAKTAPKIPDLTCQQCRHWELNESNNHGYCHRYPPTVVVVNGQAGYANPVTEASESCGEFTPHFNS